MSQPAPGAATQSAASAPPPIPVQSLQYYTPPQAVGEGIWRSGKRLITLKESTLPPRCVKCNAPAELRFGKFAWSSPWLLFLLFAGLLPYAVVAMILTQRAKVHFGICQRHRAKRRNGNLFAWGCVLLAIALLIVSPIFDLGYLSLASIPLFLFAIIWHMTGNRTLRPTKIDDKLVWFAGVCPQYLDQFPTAIT